MEKSLFCVEHDEIDFYIMAIDFNEAIEIYRSHHSDGPDSVHHLCDEHEILSKQKRLLYY